MRSDGGRVGTALEMIEAGYAMLSDESFTAETLLQLLAVHSRLEAVSWKAPAISHELIARLRAEPLATRLRISIGEARSRIKLANCWGER